MGRRRELACRELVELLGDHLDGQTDDVTSARVEEHLRGCGDCGRYADQLRQTLALARSLAVDDLGATARQPGLDALLVELRRRVRGHS